MSTINNEVKQEILGKIKAGEEVKKVAKQYGVSDRTIYAWLRKGVVDKVSALEYGKLKKENLILKEIVGILTVEVEKLKKRPGGKTSFCRELTKFIRNQLAIKAITLKDGVVAKFLGFSPSSFFYHPQLKTVDEILKDKILLTLSTNPAYDHRRIAIALGVGKKRVRRVMKLYGIKPYKRKGRWRKRRDERRPEAIYQNLIKGSFPIVPNHIWVSDFTYLRFDSKFIYLCTFMDLYTREIVGWNLSNRHTKDLVINAFFDAFQNQGKLPMFVHSDQGVEYNCYDYTKLITDLGVRVSMSRKASPWENGYQESFYDNFKTDLGLEFDRFDSIGHFVEAIHQPINYYNLKRIHTSLKMSPAHFRQQHYLTKPRPIEKSLQEKGT